MDSLLPLIVNFLKLYLPPMVANGTPVVVSKLIKTTPLDFGKKWKDGRRLLGDGKSIEGTISGIFAGTAVAAIIGVITGYTLVHTYTGFISSTGAVFGDVTKSFFKRRVGKERGEPLPLVDQLDFYLGATIFLLVCPACVHPTLEEYLFGLLLVPLLHISTNYLAYKVRLKKVPW